MKKFDTLTFSAIIPEVVAKYANHKALGFVDEEALTYAQMGEEIEAAIAFLEALDVKSGDKVVIYSQNMPNWGVVYFALQCMGVVTVPVLPDFNTHELQNVLEHSEAKAVFISQSLEHKLAEAKKKFVKCVIRIDNLEVIEGKDLSIVYEKGAKSTSTYNVDENELAILLYTSGTTGDSKGVMLSQKNVIFNSYQAAGIQPINEHDRFLSVLPLSHTYENTLGLILPILNGAGVTYLRKPPTASVLVPAMQSVKPDFMLTVPMIIEKVFKNSVLPQIKKKATTRAMYNNKLTRKLVYRIAGKKLYKTFGGNLKFFG
ncbi:MAG: AMP-binding protein, partial [Bacteroidetes bacterium]|nr:AMP-binding protein [Bacteroidota bacterium]